METELGGGGPPPGRVAWCLGIFVHTSATVASSGSVFADQPVRHGSMESVYWAHMGFGGRRWHLACLDVLKTHVHHPLIIPQCKNHHFIT